MNPFDNLGGGLASVIGYGKQCGFSNAEMNRYIAQQNAYNQAERNIQSYCIHTDCPICKENREVVAKFHKEQAEKIALKKELYEERCKEYMKKHRVIRKELSHAT